LNALFNPQGISNQEEPDEIIIEEDTESETDEEPLENVIMSASKPKQTN